ncbi:hypothetical protein SAMN05444271_102244, partial [Halohasta litchfieldiae]
SIEVSSCRMLALVDTVPTSCVFVCDAFYDTLWQYCYTGMIKLYKPKNCIIEPYLYHSTHIT